MVGQRERRIGTHSRTRRTCPTRTVAGGRGQLTTPTDGHDLAEDTARGAAVQSPVIGGGGWCEGAVATCVGGHLGNGAEQ